MGLIGNATRVPGALSSRPRASSSLSAPGDLYIAYRYTRGPGIVRLYSIKHVISIQCLALFEV